VHERVAPARALRVTNGAEALEAGEQMRRTPLVDAPERELPRDELPPVRSQEALGARGSGLERDGHEPVARGWSRLSARGAGKGAAGENGGEQGYRSPHHRFTVAGQDEKSVKPTDAYVALGSNVGDRSRTLDRALELLDDLPEAVVAGVATVRETDPVGPVDQPRFLNTVARLRTTEGPHELLDDLLRIERALGRVRDGTRWGPRTLDLDLLLHGDAVLDESGLTLPHPRLHERRFVLEPLAELAPELLVPGRGRVRDLLAGLH
jgi:2-amino-4-hydroxy-6-hydroxymethyldihydropteridine diphosphokinase